ncbi:MAG TPA: hypothetical protein VKR80_04805 [Candidatus Limnocylindria bacterium]|nr:hypothetical protein [Candidatus Limnocylindria bacterium]
MTPVAICGGTELRQACELLGLEEATQTEPRLVLADLRVPGAAAAASAFAAAIPRIVIGTAEQAEPLAALGTDAIRFARSADAAALGPLVLAALPRTSRGRTSVITLTAARGGTGRTMCAAALARRMSRSCTVMAIDATGTGALGWWLGLVPRSWSELESLSGELRPEHIELVAMSVSPGLSLVGGPPQLPSADVLEVTIDAARGLADVVLVDAPVLADDRAQRTARKSDRVLVFAYGDAASRAALDVAEVPEAAWIIGAQGQVADAFRVLPRDEGAVADAIGGRSRLGGAIGRALDELAELLVIDAT